jgi:predicted ATPase
MSGPDTEPWIASAPYVFISYSSADRAKVQRVVDACEESGFTVWFDQRSIPGGVSFPTKIVEGIQGSDVVIVCCSEDAFKSAHVRREVHLASRYNRPTLPIMLDPVAYPPNFEYFLVGLQQIRADHENVDSWLPLIIETIHGLAGADRQAAVYSAASSGATPGNLSVPSTPFIGRVEELAALRALIGQQRRRLVTLVGPGGVGKTRLAQQTATEQRTAFPDGIYLVELGSVSDPELILPAIGETLGVQESPGLSMLEVLNAFFTNKRLLLIIDNCEHLITRDHLAVAPLIARFLKTAPNLAVLATSRAPLRLTEEQLFSVAPLLTPALEQSQSLAQLEANEAISLFIARAQAVQPSFTLTGENANSIAAICTQLDGLPLAIELAAAKTRLLPPAKLLERLQQRLDFLSHHAVDIDPRHQTLRATIEWSYDLLSAEEQAAFRFLAHFPGGFTLETAATTGPIAEDIVGILLDSSLLASYFGRSADFRFTMLESIRAFGLERAQANGEVEAVQSRIHHWALDLVSTAEPRLKGQDQVVWINRLNDEYGNLAQLFSQPPPLDNPRLRLELASSVWYYWYIRSMFTEGRTWLEQALSDTSEKADPTYLKVLIGAGNMVGGQGDMTAASAYWERGLALARQMGETRSIASLLNNLGAVAQHRSDWHRAESLFSESSRQFQMLGDHLRAARTLGNLASLDHRRGHIERARARYEEALALSRAEQNRQDVAMLLANLALLKAPDRTAEGMVHEYALEAITLSDDIGDHRTAGLALTGLGIAADVQGDPERALSHFHESQKRFEHAGDTSGVARAIGNIGLARMGQGDLAQAVVDCRASLELFVKTDDHAGMAYAIETLAVIQARGGEASRAACLFGIAERIRNELEIPLPPELLQRHQGATNHIAQQMDQATFTSQMAAGAELDDEQAVALALS